MIDIVCTCYNVNEFKAQAEFYNKFNFNYPIHFITNFENEDQIKSISQEIGLNINWLQYNPGKHMGAFALASSANELLTQDYILHYHADMMFRDINDIDWMVKEFIQSNKKLAGIPRQWMFDSNYNLIDNKSLPIRSEFFFITRDLYSKIFNLDNYNIIANKCINNGHPSLHFEPLIYAGLELNKVGIAKEIHYLEDIKQLKDKYKNDLVYYNTMFERTGMLRLK
jgi:hypothetical protein